MPAKKTPNHLKILDGNYRPSKHGKINEPLKCAYPEMPSYFEGELIQIWINTRSILEPHGYIDRVHAIYLEMYCKLLNDSRTSENFTAAMLTQLRHISSDLGMSPVSFERMPKPKEDKEPNPFEGFL
jgi:phage terminase small subunit